VITGHVYGADGLPGPFVNLGNLKCGDQIIIHDFGQSYFYQVRSIYTTSPEDTSAFAHEDLPWVTLVTCKQYDANSGTYKFRTIVKAVLVYENNNQTSGGRWR
jgi:LPXTG-site transpeptidase (sortase) family protein